LREGGIVLDGPALLPQSGDGIGDRDRAFELLDRSIDQRAVRPRTAVRDVEVVAPGFGLEAGRPVSRDAVAEAAVGAPELAAGAGFLRQLPSRPAPPPRPPITPPPRARAPRRCGGRRCWRDSCRRP